MVEIPLIYLPLNSLDADFGEVFLKWLNAQLPFRLSAKMVTQTKQKTKERKKKVEDNN